MIRLQLVVRYHMRYEDEALGLARRLFARFDEAIDSLVLMPVEEDEFALVLDGRLLRAQSQSGSAPRVADVVAACEAHTAPGQGTND